MRKRVRIFLISLAVLTLVFIFLFYYVRVFLAPPVGITLTWNDNSDNEDGFRIERSIDGINFIEIDVVGQNIETYADNNVLESTTYYYRIRAYNSNGNSGYSNIAFATTLAGQCNPGPPPETRSCFSGPGTAGVGICQAGTQTCNSQGSWQNCAGEVVAQSEVCNDINSLDEDCDGLSNCADANSCGNHFSCATPVISSVTPNSIVNTQGGMVTISGTGFYSGSAAKIFGTLLPTTFISSTQLQAVISSVLIQQFSSLGLLITGVFQLNVENNNAPNANLASNAVTLTINDPLPSISSINPNIFANNIQVTLQISGSEFTSNSVIEVSYNNGPYIPFLPTTISSSLITLVIPPGLTPGQYRFRIVNPIAQISNEMLVTVQASSCPAVGCPILSSISPNNVVNNLNRNIVVSGTGFQNGAVVIVGLVQLPATFVSPTQLEFVLPQYFTSATYQVVVLNPDGGMSQVPTTLIVNEAVPLTTSLNPNFIVVGTATTVIISGNDFYPGLEILVEDSNGQLTNALGTFVRDSATQITWNVPANAFVAGTYIIKIRNPGGSLSNGQNLVVGIVPPPPPPPPTTGSGSSGGGTGSGFSWTKTLREDDKELREKGTINVELGARHRVMVRESGENHHIGVRLISIAARATIDVASHSQITNINVGENKNFDVNHNGINDLKVSLIAIFNNKARISIESLFLSPTNYSLNATGNLTSGDDNETQEDEGEEIIEDWVSSVLDAAYYLIIFILLLIIVMTLIIIIRKLRNRMKNRVSRAFRLKTTDYSNLAKSVIFR